MSNNALELDTIVGASVDRQKDAEKYFAQRSNKFSHKLYLPEFWSNPLSFPHGKMKAGETFTYHDPENTLLEAPPLNFDYLKADTTDIAFDEALSTLCSSDKNKFIRVSYYLKQVIDGKAFFDVDYYYHTYSPNSYDERIFGKGHLVYNIKDLCFTEFELSKKSYSESNLLGLRMTKRYTNTIKWYMELDES